MNALRVGHLLFIAAKAKAHPKLIPTNCLKGKNTMNAIRCDTFRDIYIPNNSLVVLDVDDTVVLFKEMGRTWWAAREKELVLLHGAEKGRELVMREWVHGAHLHAPVLTDPEEFPRFLQRVFDAGAHLIFLTARSAELRQLTEFHLTSCGVEVKSENIYFARDKGAALKSIVCSGGFTEVVFIDDMEHNLENVERALKDVANLRTHHFVKHAPVALA
jgi:hypothetical protein